jgi:peptidoglycan-N-acetylglucosamine deacetylase
MRVLRSLFASAGLVWLASAGLAAPRQTVSITVDDLPYAGGNLTPPLDPKVSSAAKIVNRKLLAALQLHRVPVTGFDLGNHTYSHPDINDLSPEQIEQEIVRGESTIGPLMNESGKKFAYFRFPMNHTGDTKVKHNAIAAFLSQRGYRLATCTIDTSDYLFNDSYIRMLAKKDGVAAQKLRMEYLAYTKAEIDYYAALSKQVFGYEHPR